MAAIGFDLTPSQQKKKADLEAQIKAIPRYRADSIQAKTSGSTLTPDNAKLLDSLLAQIPLTELDAQQRIDGLIARKPPMTSGSGPAIAKWQADLNATTAQLKSAQAQFDALSPQDKIDSLKLRAQQISQMGGDLKAPYNYIVAQYDKAVQQGAPQDAGLTSLSQGYARQNAIDNADSGFNSFLNKIAAPIQNALPTIVPLALGSLGAAGVGAAMGAGGMGAGGGLAAPGSAADTIASMGGAGGGVTGAQEAAGMLSAASSPGVAASTAAGNVATGLGYNTLGTAATSGVGGIAAQLATAAPSVAPTAAPSVAPTAAPSVAPSVSSSMTNMYQTAFGMSPADAAAAADAAAQSGMTTSQLAGILGPAGSGTLSISQLLSATTGADTSTINSWLNAAKTGGTGIAKTISDLTGGLISPDNISGLLSSGLGLAAYSAAKTPPQNPSQYVVDPVTGKVVSSSVTTPSGTTTQLDPRIQGLQQQSLAGTAANVADFTTGLAPIQAQQSDVLGKYQNLYGQAGDPFLNAALNPIKQAGATAQGALTENLGQRGMTGSSFGQQAQTALGMDYGTALSTATEGALQKQIGLQAGLAGDIGAATTAQMSTLAAKLNAGQMLTAQEQSLAGTLTDTQLAQMKMGITGAGIGATNVANQNAQLGRLLSGTGTALGTSNALYPTAAAKLNAGQMLTAQEQSLAGTLTDTQLAQMKMGITGAGIGATNVANQNAQLGRLLSGTGTALGTSNALYPTA